MKWIICFIWIVSLTKEIHSIEFNVVGSLTHANELECNTQVIIQCIVNPKTDPVFWQVGKPVTELSDLAADCSGFSCTVYSSSYNFTYDENAGESNMTIENVTLADDGKQYMCSNSSTSLIFDAVVLVPPIKETTQISNMTVAEVAKTTMITVSTGCVSNRTAERITFEWFIIPENGKVSVYKEATPPSISDDSSCQINSYCISDGSVALSNNFTITEDATASKVYFQVHILLDGDLLFSVDTTSTFQPKSVITSSPSSTPNNVSDGCINTCDCCDCDIKELIIVIAVAWASVITLTFVGSCILKYSLNIADLHECIFRLGSLPWIFLLVVVLLYKGEKKRGLIPLVISFVLDAAFIGVDRYYVCSCENRCEIELLDHLWASPIYLMVCVVLSVLKYIILEKCCKSDSTVSNSNPDLNQSDVGDRKEQPGTRPLPPMTNVSSRLGNEKEHAHSLTHVKITHHSPLPPISPKKNS